MSDYIRFYNSPAGRLTLMTDGQALNALLLQKETEKMDLTGYGGGMPMKVQLIKLEGMDINKFTIPTKGTRL